VSTENDNLMSEHGIFEEKIAASRNSVGEHARELRGWREGIPHPGGEVSNTGEDGTDDGKHPEIQAAPSRDGHCNHLRSFRMREVAGTGGRV
jgi:hypothetical protein